MFFGTFVLAAILGVLIWAFILALDLSAEGKAVALAAIGTGVALLSVAVLTLRLELLRFRRSQEPLLGIIWKEPGMYPFTEHASGDPQDVYVEYILWNAGTAPILVQQPASVLTPEFRTHHLGGSRTELLRPSGAEWVSEKAFPILLAQGETAIWRYYTGDKACLRPSMGEIVERDRAKAIRFIRDSAGDRRFVFELLHFTALPADVQQRDLRRCFVGFAYDALAEQTGAVLAGSSETSADKALVRAAALLDTSAFIAVSKEKLTEARHRGWHLTTSPWCFLELLCHLDEDSNFARAKGKLVKFHGVEIVDKPLDRVVAQSEPDSENRIWSSDLVYAALAAIDGANSLDDLNHSLIVDEAGNRRSLKDCADSVRRTLDEEVARFQGLMTKLIGLLRSGEVVVGTAEEKHNAIMSMVASGDGIPLPDTPGLDYAAADKDQVFACSYVYWGYVLHRATQLAQAGGTTCAKNDFEDGQLCAYVPLDKSMLVVSGDTRLLRILAAVRDVLMKVDLGKRACYALAGPGFVIKGGDC
jgi:hypothetical protein